MPRLNVRNMVLSAGQLISKCLFGVFNFSKKKNENKLTWGIIAVKSNFLFVFWKNWEYRKVLMKLSKPLWPDFPNFVQKAHQSFFESVRINKQTKKIEWLCPSSVFVFFNSNFYATQIYVPFVKQKWLKSATHSIEVNMAKLI